VPKLAWTIVGLALLTGCGGQPGESGGPSATAEPLTIYCGRNERLIQPILDRFTRRSGIPIRVRYGSTSELAATLMEEDRGTPAALFIAQDAAALGALSRAGLFRSLPSEVLEQVPSQFRSAGGDWVGLSGRARVIVYNVTRVEPADLPQSLTPADKDDKSPQEKDVEMEEEVTKKSQKSGSPKEGKYMIEQSVFKNKSPPAA